MTELEQRLIDQLEQSRSAYLSDLEQMQRECRETLGNCKGSYELIVVEQQRIIEKQNEALENYQQNWKDISIKLDDQHLLSLEKQVENLSSLAMSLRQDLSLLSSQLKIS